MTEKINVTNMCKCGVCGTSYLTQEEALKCAGSHVIISDIENPEYLPAKLGDAKYAEYISIRYEDGTVIHYARSKTGHRDYNG